MKTPANEKKVHERVFYHIYLLQQLNDNIIFVGLNVFVRSRISFVSWDVSGIKTNFLSCYYSCQKLYTLSQQKSLQFPAGFFFALL